MSGVLVSLDDWRVTKQGIKITFFKVLIKSSAIEKNYPGGIDAFCSGYDKASHKGSLIALTFSSMARIAECVEAMEKVGLKVGVDIATANQIHGVLDQCQGITFHSMARPPRKGTHQSFPVWYAYSERS